MLDLDPTREATPPRDAATLVVLREGKAGPEVFCVERQRVGFLGGAIVFPGGKVDPADLDSAWAALVTPPSARCAELAETPARVQALAVAACREALEEAAILPLAGAALDHATRLAWRARLMRTKDKPAETTLLALVEEAGAKLDLSRLHPLARWVTPVTETRRFDTSFFLHVADENLTGAHDDHETTASFWATPAEVLRRFDAGQLQLAPPTHRTLEQLATAADTAAAVALAAASSLESICPKLVRQADTRGETAALVLPGDPEHPLRHAVVAGRSRYVLRGDRFVPEDAPSA